MDFLRGFRVGPRVEDGGEGGTFTPEEELNPPPACWSLPPATRDGARVGTRRAGCKWRRSRRSRWRRSRRSRGRRSRGSSGESDSGAAAGQVSPRDPGCQEQSASS